MWSKLRYIFDRRQKRNLVILYFLIGVGALFELLGVSAVLPLVQLVMEPEIITTNKWLQKIGGFLNLSLAKDYIIVAAVLLIVIYVIKNVYLILMFNMQYRFTYNNQRRIAKRLMECYMSQEYLYHLSKSSAELMRNINTDVPQFFTMVLNVLQLFTELFTCFALVIFLAVQDLFTTICIVIIILFFLLVFYYIFKTYTYRLGMENRVVSAKLHKCMLQSFEGIKETKVFNKEYYFVEQYDETYAASSQIMRKQSLIGVIPKPIIESVCICGLLTVLTVRIYFSGNIENFVPVLSVFAISAFRMLPSFNRITSCMNTISFTKSSVDAVYQDLKEVELLMADFDSDQEDSLDIKLQNSLNIESVTFQYPDSDNPVLDQVKFKIPLCTSVALIGPSGAGKTTLVDIIMGLLPPQSGYVMADDIDVWKHLHAWHKILGYIPQTIYLTDDTICKNIAYGEEEIDEEMIWKAIKEAQLEEFIKQLPDGIFTVVGERGVRLSGGQRQRIGIARALYRNPSILILDEATSALDNDTETAVMEAINSLQGKKTILIIAHRLSTIKNCDIIYEVKDGKVSLKDKKEIFPE